MTDHTPPEGAVEAGTEGARVYAEEWYGIDPDDVRGAVAAILTAAHEAGKIVWREECEALTTNHGCLQCAEDSLPEYASPRLGLCAGHRMDMATQVGGAWPWDERVVADYSGALADTGTLPGDLTPPEAVRRLTAERDAKDAGWKDAVTLACAEKARADEAVARASMMLMHSRFVDCGNVGCTYRAEDYHADETTWAQQYQTAATQENRA